MLSAIIAGAGALLQAGVIALAPLLSLSLHQSYDALFDLLHRLEPAASSSRGPTDARTPQPANAEETAKAADTDAQLRLAQRCLDKLHFYDRLYKRLNPIYLASWGSTCLLLVYAAILTLRGPWTAERMVREAMQFFALSALNSSAFGLLALTFFLRVQPGVTKLDYYLEYFALRFNDHPRRRPMRLSGRALFLLVTTVLIAAIFVAFFAVRVQRQPKVAVNAFAIAAAPVLLAESEGTLDNVTLTRFPTGRAALDALINGDAILATVAETPVVLGSVDHPNLRILLTIAESELRLIANPASGIRALSDLKGKRIGVADGTSSEFFLRRMLAHANLPWREVRPVSLGPTDMPAAFGRHELDAVAIWEPFAERAFTAVPNALDLTAKGIYVERFNIVTTAEALQSAETRGVVHDFLRALVATSKAMRADEDRAIRETAELLSLEESDLGQIWQRFRYPAHLVQAPLLDTMRDVEVWAAAEQDRQPRGISDLQALLDPKPFEAAIHPSGAR